MRVPEGILPINKKRGSSSFSLVKHLRMRSGIRKIGHTGTLDHFAEGVMVMLVGERYTKRAVDFLKDDKEYIAQVKLGEETDTFDCEGIVVARSSHLPPPAAIEEAIAEFQGSVAQIPPMFSAKKIGGQKLHTLARRGIDVARQPIQIHLQTELLDYDYPFLQLKIHCSKGTYIRAIAHDLGKKMGTGAHLTQLTRTRNGRYTLEECIDADALQDPSFSHIPHLRKTR